MNEILHLQRCGIVITDRCNLFCRLCAEYSPYYKNPPYTELDKIKKAIDIFFNCVDSIGDFSLFGGEPLLHEDWVDVLIYLDKYISRINRLLVLTNGTIVPKEEFLKKLVSFPKVHEKLQFNISDYGKNLSKRVIEIESLCKMFNVKCRVINLQESDAFCGGWVDFGDHTKKFFTEKDIKEHAQNCAFRKQFFSNIRFMDGKIYFSRCARAFRRYYLGITPEDSTDIIHFPENPEPEHFLELRKKIIKMRDSEYSDACAYCNGICDDSPRFPPAQQLTKEEILSIKR